MWWIIRQRDSQFALYGCWHIYIAEGARGKPLPVPTDLRLICINHFPGKPTQDGFADGSGMFGGFQTTKKGTIDADYEIKIP